MAQVAVTKADGTTWMVDDTLLTQQLPAEPADGSFVQVTLVSGTQEWTRAGVQWRPVENPADLHPWSYVCGLDTSGSPRVVYWNNDQGWIAQLVKRVQVDGGSVSTVEGGAIRCQSNVAGPNVTVQFNATTQHLARRAAVRLAIGLLGAVGALPSGT